jgi:hypothetical protein
MYISYTEKLHRIKEHVCFLITETCLWRKPEMTPIHFRKNCVRNNGFPRNSTMHITKSYIVSYLPWTFT